LDPEGIVAKRKESRYVVPGSKQWVKVKNLNSQAKGRQEQFETPLGQ
jgi:ATP-dependent DNA ligase